MNRARLRISLYDIPDTSLCPLLYSFHKLRSSPIRNVSVATKQHTKQVHKALKDTTSASRSRILKTKPFKPITPVIADISLRKQVTPDADASEALLLYHDGKYEEAEIKFQKLSRRVFLPEDLMLRYVDCLSKLRKYDRIMQLLDEIQPIRAVSIPQVYNMALACLGTAAQLTHVRVLFDKMKFRTTISDETFHIIIQSAIRNSNPRFASVYTDVLKGSIGRQLTPEARERLTALYQVIILEFLRKGWALYVQPYFKQLKEEGNVTSQFIGNALEIVLAACKMQNNVPHLPPLYTAKRAQNILVNIFGLGVPLNVHHTAIIQLCSLFSDDNFMTEHLVQTLQSTSTWNPAICDAVLGFIANCSPEIRAAVETVVTGSTLGSTKPSQKEVHRFNVLLGIHTTNNNTSNVMMTFRNAMIASEYDTRTFDIVIQYATHINRPHLAVLLAKNMLHRGLTFPNDNLIRLISLALMKVASTRSPTLTLEAKTLMADVGSDAHETLLMVNNQAVPRLCSLLRNFNPVVLHQDKS